MFSIGGTNIFEIPEKVDRVKAYSTISEKSGSCEAEVETTTKPVSVDLPRPFPYNERNRHTAALRWV